MVAFQRQADIAHAQLKEQKEIYQQQQEENAPFFNIDDFLVDSIAYKDNILIVIKMLNKGRRTAIIEEIQLYTWNRRINTFIGGPISAVQGEKVTSNSHCIFTAPTPKSFFSLSNTYFLRIKYIDKGLKNRSDCIDCFFEVKSINPLQITNLDQGLREEFLKNIKTSYWKHP